MAIFDRRTSVRRIGPFDGHEFDLALLERLSIQGNLPLNGANATRVATRERDECEGEG